MALWVLVLLVTSVAVEGQNAPPKPQPEPTPQPTPEPTPSPPTPAACAGYECPDYDVIDIVTDGVELRRYQKAQWVRREVPGDDFVFMAVYGAERLDGFFEGQNYEHRVIKRSTPMRVEFEIWNLDAKRYASYFVPLDEQTTVPTPYPPTEIDKHGELFIYSRKYNATTDFKTVAQNVAEMMVDLTLDHSPFDMDNVFLAMYEFPKAGGGQRQSDEIWLERTFPKDEQLSKAVLREAGRNASAVFDMLERKMLN